MENITIFLSELLLHYQRRKKSFYALISLLLLSLLAYNSATIFCIHLHFPAKLLPEPESFSQETSAGRPRTFPAVPSSVTEPSSNIKSHTLLRKHPKGRKNYRNAVRILVSKPTNQFGARVTNFFKPNSSNSSCELRFFMTWISKAKSFGNREFFSVESLFKTHPKSCLIIISNSLDSPKGLQILRPFTEKGFKVAAISPNFKYLLKNTPAESWYNQLKQGNINPGDISLGQNLSNLLRLGLLYRFGGIYIDTDIIILKSFRNLKNTIGAQTLDLATGNWSRLNNAVMIFDRGHPLLYKFIHEFALTFDGNKWGHNGPYLVSRVVSRITGKKGYDFSVLPPTAFYPVDWSRIGGLFEGPKNEIHLKWLVGKLRQIRRQSFAVHLWNKESRKFKVERGSIIQHIMSGSCVVRNSSSLAVLDEL